MSPCLKAKRAAARTAAIEAERANSVTGVTAGVAQLATGPGAKTTPAADSAKGDASPVAFLFPGQGSQAGAYTRSQFSST